MKTETVMEDIVIDEAARVNRYREVMSDFEEGIDFEMFKWCQQNIDKDPKLKYHNSVYAIRKFWNERLN